LEVVLRKKPTTWVAACAARVGFPILPWKTVPHDGFSIFQGLFTMPAIAHWFRLLLLIQLYTES